MARKPTHPVTSVIHLVLWGIMLILTAIVAFTVKDVMDSIHF